MWASSQWHEPGLTGLILAFTVTATAGALMVSRFGYPSFKQFNLDRRVRFVSLLLVILIIVLIAVVQNAVEDPPILLLAIFGTYAASAPVIWLFRRIRRLRRVSPS